MDHPNKIKNSILGSDTGKLKEFKTLNEELERVFGDNMNIYTLVIVGYLVYSTELLKSAQGEIIRTEYQYHFM